MDPSYNNPQYYPPTQQDTPTQQDYPPVNSYQPQNSYSVPNTNNNLNELDQGCFKVFKIILLIEFVWHLYGIGSLAHMAIVEAYWNYTYVISFALGFSFLALILIQFIAMKDRNLQKAKMAFLGFLGYFFICLLIQIRSAFMFWSISDFHGLLIQNFFWIFFDIVLVFTGSFKVYQSLNVNQIKSEADNYSSYYKA